MKGRKEIGRISGDAKAIEEGIGASTSGSRKRDKLKLKKGGNLSMLICFARNS